MVRSPLMILILFAGQAVVSVLDVDAQSAELKPVYRSDLVTTATAAHSIPIDVDVRGLKQLFLVVEDGGDGNSHDWASWGEPRLIGAAGEKSLTDLKPVVSRAGFGRVQINRNCNGQPIRIHGRQFERGIGTHANSVIGFDLPPGYDRLKAVAGLDEGGTGQAAGDNASVRFLIYAAMPEWGGSGNDDHDPAAAVSKLDVADGLQATLFASEPELMSLTNLDVDHRGRVWVCEVVNYRGHNGERPEGDRILICSDRDGDGICDQVQVYYQGRDIDSAMGICVLGNKVIVSCSPNIWVFTDEDGDDRPDRKELLFSQTGSSQHDHSAHTFVFGPDGKLYWNFGNEGHSVHDAAGNPLVDLHGNEINDHGKPYWGGMVFRCNLDGSEMEVLAHNFRNNYEVAVDSFGTLWQSDNDDDGNRGVRINYVMEYGNYGYLDERTGAGWQSRRTGMESEIPRRHWHQEDPGVVPNLLVTGAGSPTGITVYEGDLLPRPFHNQLIHCDAGPNVVRSYEVVPDGAGYRVEQVRNVLFGARDNWFRPADVGVAPDGSLLVTDWYDPGVGGHAMGDTQRGRLFRVAPPGSRYQIPTFDFRSPESAVKALENPCQSVRYLAWEALNQFGAGAGEALQKMAADPNPRYRARALWRLLNIEGRAERTLAAAASDRDANIRCQALRMARRRPEMRGPILKRLVNDPSPAVRRELAIALRDKSGADAPQLWAQLARQYDGQDRWYLEALGIAAEGRWNECLAAWRNPADARPFTSADMDILWRSRADQTSDLIAQRLAEPSLPPATALRLFRALDFQDRDQRLAAMERLARQAEQLAATGHSLPVSSLLEIAARIPHFSKLDLPAVRAVLVSWLNGPASESEFVEWASRLGVSGVADRLLATILNSGDRNVVALATRTLMDLSGGEPLRKTFVESGEAQQLAVVHGLHGSGAAGAGALLLEFFAYPGLSTLVRSEMVKAMGQWPEGQQFVLQQVVAGTLAEDLRFPAANILLTSSDSAIRDEAAGYLSLPATADDRPLPPLAQLIRKRGDVERGRDVFANAGTCAKCHRVNGTGTEVGPDLSGVGSKLSIEALYESVLNPSAGISHNYEMYSVLLADGRMLYGVLTSQTADEIVLKDKEAMLLRIPASDVDGIRQQKKSLMPDDLQKQLTEQQLIDVIEYLQSLKQQ